MKTIIEIKKGSIKKNLNAGNTVTHIPMAWDIRFETNVPIKKLPTWIKERINEHIVSPEKTILKGYISDSSKIGELRNFIRLLKKDYTFTIKANREINTIYHLPESKYLYSYKNTKVKCSSCKRMINVNAIESDEMCDYAIELCPKCGKINTFDYKYETIKEAIKRYKIVI